MRKIRPSLPGTWLLLAAMAASCSVGGASDPQLDKMGLWTGGTRLRGANIYQRIVYPNEYDDPAAWGNGPLGPVFTQADFTALAAAGANLVVLSHPGWLDDRPPYAFQAAVQGNLDRFIGMAESAHLFVVIAIRAGPGRSEFTFFGVTPDDVFGTSHLNEEVWKDRAAQDMWVQMWRDLASRYRDRPNVVGYELMVEPNANGLLDIWEPDAFFATYANTTHDWNQMYPRITAAIREVDKDTPILIGGMSWSQVRWLSSIKPTGDGRTVYVVHQYEPQSAYTHQPTDGSGALPNRYPGRFDTDGDSQIEDFNAAWISNLLSAVDVFRAKNQAPVAVTEYGGMRWQPGLAQFLDDEMARFEQSGMNYAIWSWQPASRAYDQVSNDFNFRLGSDPANLTEGDSALFDTLRKYWAKNEVRPPK